MSKKHFVALADHLRILLHSNYDPLQTLYAERVLESLADFCRAQNPRFNRERWLAYIQGECGPNGGEVRRAKSSR